MHVVDPHGIDVEPLELPELDPELVVLPLLVVPELAPEKPELLPPEVEETPEELVVVRPLDPPLVDVVVCVLDD